MIWHAVVDKMPPPTASPVKHWLLATVKGVLQFSNMIGLSGGPEKALLLESIFTYEACTLLNQHRDQSLRATLGFIQHCLLQVLPKDTCSQRAKKMEYQSCD